MIRTIRMQVNKGELSKSEKVAIAVIFSLLGFITYIGFVIGEL